MDNFTLIISFTLILLFIYSYSKDIVVLNASVSEFLDKN